jgi:hypothetical protein
MLKKTIFGLVFILLSELLYAQAHHYSQFYNSELKLNPALTGLLQEKWRVKDVFQYRNLHNQQQIRTNTAFFEYRWQFDKIRNNYGLVVEEKRNFFMGIGIVDERRWSSNTAAAFASDYLSVAFHTKLGEKSNISIGLQPGYEYGPNRHFFDMNAGFVFGYKEIFCWQEDQFFKYQFGFAAYHLFQDFHPQTAEIYFPARQLQLHGGVLIEPVEQFNFIPNFEYIYDSQHFYNLGFTMFFFPIVHYNNYDRSRLGFHYKNTGHLCFSGGLRFFGAEKNTFSIDCALSYDMGLAFLGAETAYKDGFEVMLLITPLYKCWSIDRCGN